MGLNWDCTKIKNFDDWGWVKGRDGEEDLSPTTDRLIWLTMAVDMGEITAKNADEFYIRTCLLDAHLQPGIGGEITREDVHRHIGLKTNVLTETRKVFLRNRMRHLEREMKRMECELQKEDEKKKEEGVE